MIKTVIQTFLKSIAVTVGIFLGGLFVFLLISALEKSETKKPSSKYSVKIVAGPEGVRKSLSESSPLILQLDIKGVIGIKDLTYEKVEKMLLESQEGKLKGRVKALFLSIDSPGGTVFDADAIYRTIKRYKEQYKVPVFAHIDGICASGGLYIACAADKITAADVSLVGSVGVVVPTFVNFSKAMELVGLTSKTIKAGEHKDDLNPLRPWKENEGEGLQKVVDAYYDKFLQIVAANRPRLFIEDLRNKWGAQVFNADQAMAIGFIDEAGMSREQALSSLVEEAHLDTESLNFISLNDDNWLEKLIQSQLFQPQKPLTLQLDTPLPSELHGKFLYLWTATP